MQEIVLTNYSEKKWNELNPVVEENRIVKVSECGKSKLTAYKIGDGVTEYKELMLIGEGALGKHITEMSYIRG